jgi:hypothetical protein
VVVGGGVDIDGFWGDGWNFLRNCCVDELTKIEKWLPKNNSVLDFIKNMGRGNGNFTF